MSRHNKIANWTKSAQLGNFERNIDHQIKILWHGDFIQKKIKRKIIFSLKYARIIEMSQHNKMVFFSHNKKKHRPEYLFLVSYNVYM